MNTIAVRRFVVLSLTPALLIYALFVFVPVIWSSYYSFFDWKGIGAAKFIGLRNYAEIIQDPIFWRALKNNVIFVLVSVFGQLPVALVLAIVLHKSNALQRFIRSAVFVPMVLSSVVIGMIWQYIYHPQIGILNFLLDKAGLPHWKLEWLSDAKIAIFALAPPLVWSFVGLYLIIFISAFQNIPGDIHDAAQIDGAEGARKLFSVTLPMIWSTVQIAIILCISGSLKSFDLVYVMTKGGPAHATELLATYMYNSTFSSYRYGFGSAISTSIVLISLIFIGLSQWLTSRTSKK
ncbi:carbohydrate ABC transporter permease [Paenibacillus mucilaginosus]|uniref:Binding-protein-dependent transport system inner membrane component n=2 Tax=Paenibacillus mucilaginosus TaxID=61624 RepID=H6NN06_9BACL|nr:sugar ABC transporter permease [Paenibacillus mucilaginosus]AEI43395.1 binding-protein-dependent transport system inner membrane component [Paenibacillus mucilaginosus KNP414]AFC31046.1 binding-protein-dependent transport system inner membrane component [Paenibacillus mucilaginosus 3016]MCG7212058.1 sugar ABC transporter permease [Paenibacillus mucilaginosus]WDM24957.1 sugar ABC transporter permease [Paenibacillus mucilaginosus]WFA19632.1 sugar ABC transporter permease [Paenibacillus mucila